MLINPTSESAKELNIWDEKGCGRCGACCYWFRILALDKKEDTKCQYLVVDEKNHLASCSIYNDKKRPKNCGSEDGWSCFHGSYSEGRNKPNALVRKILREIAVNVLHSRPESALEKEYRSDLKW